MIGPILIPYATQTLIPFALFEPDGVDFCTTFSFESGDATIALDGGTEDTTDNTPVDEGTGASITVSATEATCKMGIIYLVDQTGTKLWLDDYILYYTYGNSNAQYDLNMIADHVIRRTFQNACDSSDGDTKTGRSLLGAIAKLVNKIAVSGATLTVYEDDDTTSLFTQGVTTNAGGDPIVTLDTT